MGSTIGASMKSLSVDVEIWGKGVSVRSESSEVDISEQPTTLNRIHPRIASLISIYVLIYLQLSSSTYIAQVTIAGGEHYQHERD